MVVLRMTIYFKVKSGDATTMERNSREERAAASDEDHGGGRMSGRLELLAAGLAAAPSAAYLNAVAMY